MAIVIKTAAMLSHWTPSSGLPLVVSAVQEIQLRQNQSVSPKDKLLSALGMICFQLFPANPTPLVPPKDLDLQVDGGGTQRSTIPGVGSIGMHDGVWCRWPNGSTVKVGARQLLPYLQITEGLMAQTTSMPIARWLLSRVFPMRRGEDNARRLSGTELHVPRPGHIPVQCPCIESGVRHCESQRDTCADKGENPFC